MRPRSSTLGELVTVVHSNRPAPLTTPLRSGGVIDPEFPSHYLSCSLVGPTATAVVDEVSRPLPLWLTEPRTAASLGEYGDAVAESPINAVACGRMVGSSLIPMLTVKDASKAADFYARALGATEGSRHQAPTGHAVVQMFVDGLEFYVVDENPDAFNLSPETLGGTSVRMSLIVHDPDSTTAEALAAGATEVFPVDDQPYGLRQGRVADPFGHHWLIGKPLS